MAGRHCFIGCGADADFSPQGGEWEQDAAGGSADSGDGTLPLVKAAVLPCFPETRNEGRGCYSRREKLEIAQPIPTDASAPASPTSLLMRWRFIKSSPPWFAGSIQAATVSRETPKPRRKQRR